MMNFIIAGGTIDIDFALSQINAFRPEDRYIIACDGGFKACLDMGLTPDFIIGDFDSAGDGLYRQALELGCQVKKLNPVKDDTDSEASINQALAANEGDITILGGTGSRLDHVVGNMSLLAFGHKQGRMIYLLDPTNRIYMLPAGSWTIARSKQHGKYISIFPYMGRVTGLSMTGFKYPLDKVTLTGFTTLTVSNEIVEEEGLITFEEGHLLVMETRD